MTKLSSSGNSLIYSTYLGGGDMRRWIWHRGRWQRQCLCDGLYRSSDFPTLNPYQQTYQGGETDAFVTKLSWVPTIICGDADGMNDSTSLTRSS